MQIQRIPPQNIEAERAVIGAMMISTDAIVTVAETLIASDFYRMEHRVLFQTIIKLNQENKAADIVTVTEELRKDDKLDSIGGIICVTGLANAVPTAANVEYYANIVKENAQLRGLIKAATEIATSAYERQEDVPVIMDRAESQILSLAAANNKHHFAPMKDLVLHTISKIEKVYQHKGGITGVSTGFKDLDNLTAGLQPSDFIIVAGRPSMGKTAFTLNMATYASLHLNKQVAFFSLEMSQEQLLQRMICAEGAIDSQRMRVGNLDDTDWGNILAISDKLSKSTIHIDDTPGISVMEVRSRARRLKAEHGLDLIIIDYLQLMQGHVKSNSENRHQEISDISRTLKALARELNVPVVALSQLSRSVESRQVKTPMLSDLRESGSLEQDADVVMFLYREDYYNPESAEKNITEVNIAKHRNGPTDTVRLFFHKQFTRFTDLTIR